MSAQALAALDRANEIRCARAAYKRDLAAMPSADARAEVAAILRTHADGLTSDALEMVRTMRISELLCSIDRFGAAKLTEIANAVKSPRVAGQTPVRKLSPRESLGIAAYLTRTRPRSRQGKVSDIWFQPTEEQAEVLASLYRAGWGSSSLGLWIGRSPGAVTNALRRSGVDVEGVVRRRLVSAADAQTALRMAGF